MNNRPEFGENVICNHPWEPNENLIEKVFSVGGMWEFSEWKIIFDYNVQEWPNIIPCKHCYNKHNQVNLRSDGSSYIDKVFVCPRLIYIENEGGCNSTGLCLDCVLEVAQTLNNE